MSSYFRCTFFAMAVLWMLPSPALAQGQPHAPAFPDKISYERDIKPILAEKCLSCHGSDEAESGLRLTDRDSALALLDSGRRAIVPGDLEKSELFRRVTTMDESQRMPPEEEALSDTQISLVRRWILEGATWDVHWAYRPLASPTPPPVKDSGWTSNPIDRFVLARLEASGISPSPRADRYTLIKRLYYDLLGLPPAPADVDQFVNDVAPDAYERLVDRVLASPHFGERWGRHWLDKARYADSDGYEKDNVRPDAWHFRDWVIEAINADVPFDQFTIQQLSGDLLPEATPSQRLATAFNRQTLTNTEGGTDQEQWRVAAVMDRTETLGTVWLGLTVGCARCHSHKYDQLTQREYYQLFAFFNNGDETNTKLPPPAEAVQRYRLAKAEFDQLVASLQQQLDGTAAATVDAAPRVRKELDELKKKAPKEPTIAVRVISERVDKPRKTHVLRRGEFKEPLEEVRPDALSTLPPLLPRHSAGDADRLDLARWLVEGRNPLTPRVTVNHMWDHLFGEGLVRTINDFGVRGEPPTHPELLDYLAAEFIRRRSSRKEMIRLIVTSETYRQSSRHRPELSDVDPTNRLLYRQNRFRVEAEIIRDLCLAASGLFCDRIGGPSVFPAIPASVTDVTYNSSFKWTTSSGGDQYRRGMYTFFKRTAPHPNLTTFDCPDSNVTNVKRNRSNTPIGALVLLNNRVYVEASQALAKKVLSADVANDTGRISLAFRLCLARPPTPPEAARLTKLVETSYEWYRSNADQAEQLVGEFKIPTVPVARMAAWTAAVRMILNLDEFITRE